MQTFEVLVAEYLRCPEVELLTVVVVEDNPPTPEWVVISWVISRVTILTTYNPYYGTYSSH